MLCVRGLMVALAPPPHPKVSPGFCSSGEPRCDKPARLYAQGWRCPEHAKVHEFYHWKRVAE